MTEKNTPEVVLRVRITSLPTSSDFDEFDLRRYRVGDTYELPLRLATLLIIGGYAESTNHMQAEASDLGQLRFPKRKP